MKRSLSIGVYFTIVGLITVVCLLVIVAFGNQFVGAGDGFTVAHRLSPLLVVVPAIVPFVAGVIAASVRSSRARIWCMVVAHLELLCFVLSVPGDDRLVVSGLVAIPLAILLPAWLLLIMPPRRRRIFQ